MDLALPVLIVSVIVLVLLVLAVAAFVYAKVRFKIATPDEALIITGRKSGPPVINPETGEESTDLSGQRVVIGGGTFVKPVFEQVARLSRASQIFSVTAEDATTKSGVGVTLRSIAVVKVGGTERMVRAAAQRFAGRSQEQVIEQQTSEVLVGVLRTIAGTLTVESILYERQDFSKEVKDIAVPMLAERGLPSVAAPDYAAPTVVVVHTDDPEIQSGAAFKKVGLQVAAGVPLFCGEGEDWSTVRLGLFGLDKLEDVDATIERLREALDQMGR